MEALTCDDFMTHQVEKGALNSEAGQSFLKPEQPSGQDGHLGSASLEAADLAPWHLWHLQGFSPVGIGQLIPHPAT